jgi:hypothetical protein
MAPCGCRRWLSISEGTGQILKLFRIDHPIEATILGGATDGSTRRRQNSRETGCPSQALSRSNALETAGQAQRACSAVLRWFPLCRMSLTRRRKEEAVNHKGHEGHEEGRQGGRGARRQGERQIKFFFSLCSLCPLWFNLLIPLRLSAFA